MKNPSPLLLRKPILLFSLFSLLFAFSVTLFAQTTTGTSLITEMKAAVRIFNSTLKTELNPNTTEVLQSAPVSGKKIGDPLTAGEWNRMLELVAQGGTGGNGGSSFPPIICQKNFTASAGANRAGTAFTATDCGGTLPDNTYIGVLSKFGIPGGEYYPNAINAGETVEGYAGPGFFAWSVTATGGAAYVRIVYIKKTGGGGGTTPSGSNIIKGRTSVGFFNAQPHSTMADVSFGRICTNPIITVQSVSDSILCGNTNTAGPCPSIQSTSQDLHAYFRSVTATGFQAYLSGTDGVWVGASSPAFYINYIVACD